MVKIVCISDTHGDHKHVRLPAGDVLIHAGDITAHGTAENFIDFLEWFSSQPFKHKVFIAGNHDAFLEDHPQETLDLLKPYPVHYLNDSGITIEGVKIWGSPITPRFFNWSFMRDPGEDIERHWRLIPDDTRILVTHGPVWGVLDTVERSAAHSEHTGCPLLAEYIQRLQPEYHLFGHIHEGYGQKTLNATQYLNVSTMNKHYQITNPAVVIDIDDAANF